MLHINKNGYGGQVAVTQDGGLGSSGKGCLNVFLALHHDWHWACCNFMPNAGHWATLENGERILTQQIPSAFVNKSVKLFLGAGSAIDPQILLDEVRKLDDLGYDVSSRLHIHPNAAIIGDAERQLERQTIQSGSTFKGCGAALANKALRRGTRAIEDKSIWGWVDETAQQKVLDCAYDGGNILIEGAQGIDLDINHGQYPFVTSRQTLPGQIVADVGIPFNLVSNVILNWRTHPIRISNTSAADGSHKYSGDCFGAPEIDWETVAKEGGYTYEQFMNEHQKALLTSVTKKTRRVFRFPRERADVVFKLCGGPGFVLNSLNFINFIDREAKGITPKVEQWLEDNWSPMMRDSLMIVRWGEKPSECAVL